jgi:DNA-binding PadR family transcriptional regulator
MPSTHTAQPKEADEMDVRTLCLGILTKHDATGYEIKKILETKYSHFFDASYGSIYPALNKLTKEGLISRVTTPQSGRPDKKVYSITSSGRMAFLDALQKLPGPDRVRSEFLAVLAFAELLPARHLSVLLDQRIAQYETLISELFDCEGEPMTESERFVCGYGAAVYRTIINYLRDNRHMVEGAALLAETRAAE